MDIMKRKKSWTYLFFAMLVVLSFVFVCSAANNVKQTTAHAGSYVLSLVAVKGDGNYIPTQIVNGSFTEMPWMDYVYNGVTYKVDSANKPTASSNLQVSSLTYNQSGWNTSDDLLWKGTVFEHIVLNPNSEQYSIASARVVSGVDVPYNPALVDEFESGENLGCVELNSSSAAVLYQDLKTYSGDVIRWSLNHAVRTEAKKGTPDVQSVRVEIGATPFDKGQVVMANGNDSGID